MKRLPSVTFALLTGVSLAGAAYAQPIILPLQPQPREAPPTPPSPVPVAPPQAQPTVNGPVVAAEPPNPNSGQPVPEVVAPATK